MRIGIDLMGSDTSPNILYEAVTQAAEQLDVTHSLIVFATGEVVRDLVGVRHPALHSIRNACIEFHVASEVIEMADDPLIVVRRKKSSSLVTGIRLLKKRVLDAFVSAGNTGALIASATLSLPMLPGISRPALITNLPTQKGNLLVLDVGGNLHCKARHLVQFAHLGAAFQRSTKELKSPKVGLLNIGAESKKGTVEHRHAYSFLESQAALYSRLDAPHFVFTGNIEAREVFHGNVDVLVTDGFTGNVLLKSSEGIALFIFELLQKSLGAIQSSEIEKVLQELKSQFNYAEYPGAFVCGVDGVVVKCHGNSSSHAMLNGIKGAAELVRRGVVEQIKDQLSECNFTMT